MAINRNLRFFEFYSEIYKSSKTDPILWFKSWFGLKVARSFFSASQSGGNFEKFPNGIFFGELTNFGVNFWCIFEPHFFRVYYFSSKQEACQVLCEQEVNVIMPGCDPSYLKTVSQQVVSPSIFDSQHRHFGWNHADSHQFWLVKNG